MAKKISTTTIEKIIKANTPENIIGEFTIAAGKTVEVTINPYISFEDYCQAANEIANNCYDADGNYHPEFFDFTYNTALLEYFTNIDMGALNDEIAEENYETEQEYLEALGYSNNKAKEKLHQIHILSTFTDLINEIERTVKQALDIKKDAKAIIEHRNSTKVSPWDSVAYGVMGILDKISDFADKSADKFGDMKPEDMKNIMGLATKLTNMDESAIVDKILQFRDETAEK